MNKDDHYYLEAGRVHFTEEHLIKRGACCGGNCRHWPYDVKFKGNNTLKGNLN